MNASDPYEALRSLARLHALFLRGCDILVDMKVNADLTKIVGAQHETKWVALTKDRREVVDSADTLSELRLKIDEKKNKVVYMKVLPFDMEFAFLQ